MKLSLVFELLLIFILLAFAASKSVKKHKSNARKGIQNRDGDDKPAEENSINKYCKCVEAYCNCCRDFKLPIVELNGPGCASLMYLNGDKMAVSLSFGKKVITNRTLSSRKPSPVCMPLPGGVSKFCGRVYNIARAGEEFRACLGLELQTKSTVEAAVRVSCFKFGPRGVTSEPADPLPLVPQDEKADDDDDDDYDDEDDDDFGLGEEEDDDDDDDDEDDGPIDAVNDVDTADYTGFSLLGEDLLGDLFGSAGGKKSNKNKKKQAPLTSPSTTTTTWRPRPSRRPTRRPSTRTTTPRPTRSTTVKIRPAPGKRPTRRPNRRPTRRPTTEKTSTSILTTTTTTTTTTTAKPVTVPVPPAIQTIAQEQVINAGNDKIFDELPVLSATTPKSVTDFEDSGLEMSLAHITGQLSVMPVTPMLSNEPKDSVVKRTEEPTNYEKVETFTRKTPSTIPFATSVEDDAAVNDDMIQIVQNLDSQSAESMPEKEKVSAEESRAHLYNLNPVQSNYYEGLSLPKRNKNNQFNIEDLDVLDLTQIGESLGTELGIFGRRKRQNKNKDQKIKDANNDSNEYDELFESIGDGLMMMRKSGKDNKKDRRRQNKMMRGVWS